MTHQKIDQTETETN